MNNNLDNETMELFVKVKELRSSTKMLVNRCIDTIDNTLKFSKDPTGKTKTDLELQKEATAAIALSIASQSLAIQELSATLSYYFTIFFKLEYPIENRVPAKTIEQVTEEELLSTKQSDEESLWDLYQVYGLPSRVYNALMRAEINTIPKAIVFARNNEIDRMSSLRNYGDWSDKEFMKCLKKYLEDHQSFPPYPKENERI